MPENKCLKKEVVFSYSARNITCALCMNLFTSFSNARYSQHILYDVITRLSIGTYPNVDFRATVRLAFKQFWSCIRRTPTPRFKTLSLLEYVTESKICKEQKIQPELLRIGRYLNPGNADVANDDDDDDDRQALTVMALLMLMMVVVI